MDADSVNAALVERITRNNPGVPINLDTYLAVDTGVYVMLFEAAGESAHISLKQTSVILSKTDFVDFMLNKIDEGSHTVYVAAHGCTP